MIVNYEWNCKEVEAYKQVDGNTDVIHTVHFKVTGTADGVVYGTPDPLVIIKTGIAYLDTSNTDDFIDADSLTHADIIEWTHSTLGQDRVESIENKIKLALIEMENPSSRILNIE